MLKAKLEALQNQYDDEVRDHEEERAKLESQINKLTMEIEEVLRELQVLQDAKLSLELEIACYRKLLEAEEKRYEKHNAAHIYTTGDFLLSDNCRNFF